MMSLKPTVYTFCTLAMLSASIAHSQQQAADAPTEPEFIAILQPTEGNDVSGTVTFLSSEEGVIVDANIEGLAPATAHGFHIHEFGDCSAADASSAGDHFNPGNQPHGAPDSERRHAGDLGNLLSDGVGVVQESLIDTQLAFSGANSIVGRAVVIHANADDLESQPSGESGPPLACGVIEANNS